MAVNAVTMSKPLVTYELWAVIDRSCRRSRPTRKVVGHTSATGRHSLALARERLDEASFEWLVAAMRLCMETESLVVLRYVCSLEVQKAEEVARWAAFALVKASLGGESKSVDSGSDGRTKMYPNPV